MKERIKELEDIAKEFLMHERFSRYGESIEEEYYEFYPDELKHFVELIRQEEREACAKVCEKQDGEHDCVYAAAIRARGEQ